MFFVDTKIFEDDHPNGLNFIQPEDMPPLPKTVYHEEAIKAKPL
jgi:hypothetical protein